MVRIREHKDHIIAVTNMAGHRRLGAESDPAGASEVTVIAVYPSFWLRSSGSSWGAEGNNVPGRLIGSEDVDDAQREDETRGHRPRRARGRLSRPGRPDTGPY